MPDKRDTMPADVKITVLATIDRPGLTPMQAIASGMITHQDAMEDAARLYRWDIHLDDETTEDADMVAVATEIVDDAFSQF
jgi:hypothetical protein